MKSLSRECVKEIVDSKLEAAKKLPKNQGTIPSTVTLGNNVTIVNCNFDNATQVYVGDNTTLINCTLSGLVTVGKDCVLCCLDKLGSESLKIGDGVKLFGLRMDSNTDVEIGDNSYIDTVRVIGDVWRSTSAFKVGAESMVCGVKFIQHTPRGQIKYPVYEFGDRFTYVPTVGTLLALRDRVRSYRCVDDDGSIFDVNPRYREFNIRCRTFHAGNDVTLIGSLCIDTKGLNMKSGAKIVYLPQHGEDSYGYSGFVGVTSLQLDEDAMFVPDKISGHYYTRRYPRGNLIVGKGATAHGKNIESRFGRWTPRSMCIKVKPHTFTVV